MKKTLNNTKMEYIELKQLYKTAKKIVGSNISWQEKYNIIFSDEIYGKTDFEWEDPDMDYEDDVVAYMSALKKHLDEQKIIAQQIL